MERDTAPLGRDPGGGVWPTPYKKCGSPRDTLLFSGCPVLGRFSFIATQCPGRVVAISERIIAIRMGVLSGKVFIVRSYGC